jgi:hypothetical protein
MNPVRLTLSTLTGFIFIFGFELVFHGVLLKPAYEATATLWRGHVEMLSLFPVMLAVQFIAALLFNLIYALISSEYSLKQGFRFGLLMGLLLATLQLINYVTLPIPLAMATAWFSAVFFETLVLGVLAGLIYKR